MSVSGALARPLLAGIFVSSGVEALRDPEVLAKKADDVAPAIARTLGLPTTDTVTLVRINGAIQVTAGTMLAFGKFRRLSALVLAASLVPTTYAGHRFWDETDPDERSRQQRQFLKNAAMLGGLILAASDTGGRPSLPWAARKAAGRGLEASAAAAGAVTESATKLADATKDLTKDVSKEAAAGVVIATTQAAMLSRRAARAAKAARKADIMTRVADEVAHKAEVTKQATRRARKAAEKAEVTRRAAAAARKAADAAQKADLTDLTKRLTKAAEKAADSNDLAEFGKRARRAARRAAKAARKSPLSKRARRAAHRAAKAARKSDMSRRAARAAAKAQEATRHGRDAALSIARDVSDRTREAFPIGA